MSMTFSQVVTAVHEALLFALRTGLRETATVPQPQVHLFTGDPGPAYAGCVVAREFDRGDDAAWAIRGLGYPPSTLPASRVLIVWEHADLLISLNARQPLEKRALAFLDATINDYSVTWYPFEVLAGSDSTAGVRWGEPHTADRPALPRPIIEVLDIWREFLPDDFAATVGDLEEGGYKYIPVGGAVDRPPTAETVHHMIGAALATGDPTAVERACQALRGVLTAMPADDPRRGLYLVDFSLILQLHYENSGDLHDAEEAVSAARDAASYPDGGMLAKRLNALGTALRIWYEQTGESAALSEAITVSRQAVDVIPDDDPNYGTCLANLAWALHALFMADGDAGSLDAALSAARRAFDVLDVPDPRREVVAMSLGVLLHSKYSRTGELAVLNEAIDLGRSATVDSTSSGWMLAARLTNLGRALEARYRRTGELDSLREATRTERRALVVAPPDHTDRTIYQLNLSGTLRALFDRTGDPAVLDEAFAVARDAVKDVPAGHPFRINHLANLGLIHHERYAQTADVAELDTARTLLREALADASATHPHRPAVLSALGECLHAISRHTAEFGQLEEATKITRNALDSIADDHPYRGTILRTLADIYQTRHHSLGDQAALTEAIELLRAAATNRTSPMRARVDAARRWGGIAAAAGLTRLALDGLATAVELLPLLAARSLHRSDSEYWLSQYGGLASDAAALALEMNSPDRAVELLELGRTVLIAQALEIRTDLSALRDQDPRLADRFEWLSVRLENDDGEQPDSRRALADELEAVIAAARALPGMDRFLLPPKAAELLAQAGQGPIVVVNISAYRCDALVLTDNGLRLRPLPQLTPGIVSDHVTRFLNALATDCQSQFRRAREHGEQILAETMSWLWHNVCAPVLDTVPTGPGRRMWWIPTGLLGFLPLHAAGDQATGESTLDRAVSSYTPSVRALAHARSVAGDRPSTRTLVVGMPHTPNDRDLPGAFRETSLVAERAPGPRKLIGPDATSAAVTAALQHSAWAHFACHAITATSPSDSHLLLHDHDQRPLTAAAVSRLRLDAAALAYLSACHTAVSTTDLADEVIHIASAFHMAGYPHVIGTLWAVNDAAAATIAELVYTELTSGHPDPHRAPAALRNALTRMRENHPRQPSRWASHIHIGI
jgi:tetratricopeptide (TPR) repeat protein